MPRTTNRELFAAVSADPLEMLRSSSGALADASLNTLTGRIAASLAPCSGGSLILTDDKAPVELLGMKMIDLLISDEVSYYKKIYKEEGLRGLIDSLM